jgi:hypothetical protein
MIAVSTSILTAACASGRRSGARETGAATPRKAVETFLAAVHAQDLQAISLVWGTAHGPARDVVNRGEIERREIIMVCFLNHDKASIGDDHPGENGQRVFPVTLTKNGVSHVADFSTVEGPHARWYVENADILKLKDFCRSPGDSLQFQMVEPRAAPTQ